MTNLQQLKEEARAIIDKKQKLDIFSKKCKITKDKVKKIRKFLQETEDNTEEYNDCDLSKEDLWNCPSQEVLNELLACIYNARILTENIQKLEKEKRLTGYCFYCLDRIAKGEEMKKCFSNNCKNDN